MTAPDAWWGDLGCHQAARGVHRIPLTMPNDGLRAVNVYAIEVADGLVLVDGGWAVDSAFEELRAALARIDRTPREISDVYVTHVHRDHYTFAVRLRERYGTRVHLGAPEAPGLAAVRRLASNVPASSLRELARSGAADLGARVEAATAPLPFDTGDWSDPDGWVEPGPIDLGGRVLEAVATPGHTKGHVVYHDLEHGLLFSGDHVLPTITPSIGFELGPWDLPLKHFLTSLELLLGRPDARLLPAHGYPTDSVHERVRALLEHHRARFDEVQAAVREAGGRASALEVAQRLRWTRRLTPFQDLDDFNSMIAVCETIAHLDVLVDRDELDSGLTGGVEIFRA
ncbi:MBL fold metallo-hydrolase [Aeromicrobium alkaliterrae]|uniref:MBL fold metallo-hydrolase n=1 Tax=Aeromicrobium alkaliterrae TaxID=302168 RepID=A0ABN2JEL7_9ACTN